MLRLLKPASPEDLFVERYDKLLSWALSITNHNRAQAEDLVHDAFIQFSHRRGDLAAIENTDAYLNRMLRNMYLSEVRRASLTPDSKLSIADFDSAEMGLRTFRAGDPSEHLELQDDLRRICQYTCRRKGTSKAGSVLILRFFHSYYPSEIAKVLRTTRVAVDRWLAIARREAKLFLSDPTALKFMTENAPARTNSPGYARSVTELIGELRETIFAARAGECLNERELKELYRGTTAIDGYLLSHVVSCPRCLDAVNRLLDLPLLAERTPDERLGRDVPPDKSGGGSVGGPPTSIVQSKKKYERREKEVMEHRPQELRICVNGFVLGTQEVNSELSKLALTVNIDEPIGFVEVFSEQNVRLLFFDVDAPTDGRIEQTTGVDFNCGRTLDLGLSFRGPWPTVNLSYHDPTFEAVASSINDFDLEELPEAALAEAGVAKESRARFVPLWLTSLVGRWPERPAHEIVLGRRVPRETIDWHILQRPAVVTAMLSVIILAAALVAYYRRSPAPALSAADLLQRAAAAENLMADRRDQVLHRTLRLEEKSASGQLLSSRRIEVWHSAEKGITARRLFDENGSLIAGEWQRADGVRTIYHHGRRSELQLAPQKRGGQSEINFENVWQIDVAARDFSSLIGKPDEAKVQERGNSYVLSADSASLSSVVNHLVSVSLVLTRDDLHSLSQTIVVRQGNETREYTFTETSFERRSPNSVAPGVFEPEPVLLASSELETRNPKLETAAVDAASPFLATPELELQVLKQLNQADAFYGEQITLTRTSEGRLRVQGIVETDKRKTEIMQSLASLQKNPAVQIQIETVAEASARQARQRVVTNSAIESGSVEVDMQSSIPAAPELRAYLSKERDLSSAALDQEIQRFADRVMTRSRQARRHALALSQIAQRFSADDLRGLDEASKNQWRAMMGQHAKAIEQELEALRRELQPVFPLVATGEAGTGVEIASDADFARAAKRLYELVASVDESVGRSFSIYASGGPAAIKTGEFSQSLRSAVGLAAKIARD